MPFDDFDGIIQHAFRFSSNKENGAVAWQFHFFFVPSHP